MYMPIQESIQEHPGVQYLQQSKDILEQWKKSGNIGLTPETFIACIQSIGAIPELAKYLIEKHDFKYVLTGKLMSDPLEGRFGWYRQTNGGNFFMSVKQLLQSEKTIRCLSLLQQEALLAASTAKDDAKSNTISSSASEEDYLWLSDIFSEISLDHVSQTDAAVSYYVSGYIGRKIAKRRKCSECKNLLTEEGNAPEITGAVPAEHKRLFEMADRGGLSIPSEFLTHLQL